MPIPEIPDQDNMVSYYSKYENKNINDAPGLFIFLVDQSGSMHYKSIELVKQGLLLFIQSLPSGSYFQLIDLEQILKNIMKNQLNIMKKM